MALDALSSTLYFIAMADIISYSIENVQMIGKRLRDGKVGIFPCDTIYGLCGIADPAVAERLYEVKRRPASKSFITLMTKEQVAASGLIVPQDILGIWPAPLTAILADKDGNTKAVRVPSDPFIQALLPVSGPIFSTSVNISGEKSLLTFSDILPVFSESVDFIVENDEIKGGVASTLIDATHHPYKVLRQGAYII